MNKLFAFLGAGRLQKTGKHQREYLKALYYFPATPKQTHKSPFVVDAILELGAESYDQIYLFGTDSSMWETLYYWLFEMRDAKDTEQNDMHWAELERLIDVVNSKGLEPNDPVLDNLEKALSAYWGSWVECRIIPHGITLGDYEHIFSTLVSLVNVQDCIDLDITHGYRHLPLVTLLVIRYCMLVEQVRVRRLYYGAIDMRGQFEGKVPILDLAGFVSGMFQWMDAVSHFLDTGDGSEVASLLPEESQTRSVQNFQKRLQSSSVYLQYNNFRHIRAQLSNLLQSFEKSWADLPTPLQIMSPVFQSRLQEFVTSDSQWEILVKLAHQFKQYGLKTQALITAYDAARNAVGEALGIQGEYSEEDNKRINSKIQSLIHQPQNSEQAALGKIIDWFRSRRNSVAHADYNIEPQSIDRDLQDKLNALHGLLQSVRL